VTELALYVLVAVGVCFVLMAGVCTGIFMFIWWMGHHRDDMRKVLDKWDEQDTKRNV